MGPHRPEGEGPTAVLLLDVVISPLVGGVEGVSGGAVERGKGGVGVALLDGALWVRRGGGGNFTEVSSDDYPYRQV